MSNRIISLILLSALIITSVSCAADGKNPADTTDGLSNGSETTAREEGYDSKARTSAAQLSAF